MLAELQLLLSKIAPMALLSEVRVILALVAAILGLMRWPVRLACISSSPRS
ncbi:MAG: hypothetical protein ACK4TL_03995 [Hyphomicrobiaceae bacterium]